jgi:hypothetical protein
LPAELPSVEETLMKLSAVLAALENPGSSNETNPIIFEAFRFFHIQARRRLMVGKAYICFSI